MGSISIPTPQPEQHSLPISTMPLISPHALLQAHLSQTPPSRLSNRSPTTTRPIHLNTSSLTYTNGSSVLKIGESTIVCGVRAEILPVSEIPHYRASTVTRTPDAEEDWQAIALNNLLVPNLELATSSHPLYAAGTAPSAIAQSLSQRLLSHLLVSRVVRRSDLEIRYTANISEAGLDPDDPAYIEQPENQLKAYWVLYIDCVCLGFGGEGATFDAAWLAILAALRDTKLPKAWWDDDERVVLCSADTQSASSLDLQGMPVPLSFGVFTSDPNLHLSGSDTGSVNGLTSDTTKSTLLVDLDVFEDEACTEKGCVSIDIVNGEVRIIKVEKVGGVGAMGVNGVKELVRHAEKRWHDWKRILAQSGHG